MTASKSVDYLVLLDIHIIGATAIFGIGLSIAFVMLVAHMTRDTVLVGRAAVLILTADAAFAVTALLVQPISGYLLMRETGFRLTDGWLGLSIALYAFGGLLGLFLARLQLRMRALAQEAVRSGSSLPAAYDRLFKRSFGLAILAFLAISAVLVLMIARPALS